MKTLTWKPFHKSNTSHFSTQICHTAPNSSLANPECAHHLKKSVRIWKSNCGHRKKTTRDNFQLFWVLGCILRSPVCDDEHCLIFKGSHLFAILFGEPVLQNAFLAVELENEIIRFAHQSFSVPTSMKRYTFSIVLFLDRFVIRHWTDLSLTPVILLLIT